MSETPRSDAMFAASSRGTVYDFCCQLERELEKMRDTALTNAATAHSLRERLSAAEQRAEAMGRDAARYRKLRGGEFDYTHAYSNGLCLEALDEWLDAARPGAS